MFQDGTLEWYPEYTLDVGAYAAEPQAGVDQYWRADWHVYRRDFENAMVLVNSSEAPVTVPDLGGTYRLASASGGLVGVDGPEPGSLSSTLATSVTLPAYTPGFC